jgi:hypothetical protein
MKGLGQVATGKLMEDPKTVVADAEELPKAAKARLAEQESALLATTKAAIRTTMAQIVPNIIPPRTRWPPSSPPYLRPEIKESD